MCLYPEYRAQLLVMSARDLKLREGLLQEGKLFGGYNKEMEKLHNDNAQRLEEIINAIGWPTGAKVGTDGAEAAWLILQHAIARPDLLKSCLSLLQQAAERGEIPAKYPAYLEDRICFFQGQPQKYGTQFDWDEKGQLNYWPLQDEENVDQLRKDIGLPPLAEQVKVMRQRAAREGEKPPDERQRRQQLAWCRKTGWRDQGANSLDTKTENVIIK